MSIAIAKTNKILITIVKNVFAMESGTTEVEYRSSTFLSDICDSFLPKGDWLVAIGGRVFQEFDWSTTEIFPGDQVVFVPNLGGPIPAILSAISTSAVLSFAVKVGVAYGIGQLVQKLAPQEEYNSSYNQHNTISTQFKGWEPQTLQQPGLPIPKYFGENQIFGNIIHAWTEPSVTGLAQVLKAIICYGRGPVEGITNSDLGPNIFLQGDQPIQNFTNVSYEERFGTLHQSALSLFSDGVKLEFRPKVVTSYGTPRIHIVKGDDYDGLDVEISFPEGLYHISGGSVSNHSVGIKIEIAENGTDDWETLVEKTITAAYDSEYLIPYNNEETYDGGSPVTITRGTEYKVKLTKTTTDEEDETYGDTLQLNAIRTIYTDGFEYPGLALLGVSIEATDQLSGSFECSVIQKGRVCEVYSDSDTSTIEWTEDPAWIMYNIATNPLIYGGRSGTIETADLTTKGLVAHWKLDDNEAASTTVLDNTDNEYYGTFNNYTSTRSYAGTIDRCLYFDGSDRIYVDDDDGLQIMEDDFTFSLWAKWDSLGTYPHVFLSRFDVSLSKQWTFCYYPALGKMLFHYNNQKAYSDSWTPSTGTWYHIGFVRSGTSCAFFVDGTAKGTDLLSTIDNPDGNPLCIGMGYYSNQLFYMNGYFDDFRIYNRALTSDEIDALASKESETPEEEWSESILPYEVKSYRGLNPDQINLDDFLALSDRCSETIKNIVDFGGTEEARYTLNGGWDDHSNRWAAIKKICQHVEAIPTWNGHKLGLAFEGPKELSQIFNISNIQKRSFSVKFLNQTDRPSEVTVEYKKDYERSQITAVDTTISEYKGIASLERLFFNSESMAWRAAATEVLRLRNVKFQIEFLSNRQAIACRPGDKIRVAHPVFTLDQCGGRITQVIGSDTIQIDTAEDQIPALSATSRIAIRTVDDEGREIIDTYPVVQSSGGMVKIEEVWENTPQIDDTFILGSTETFETDFDVFSIRKYSDLDCRIVAQQHYSFKEHQLDDLV